jgi:DNA mismatch repair protein MutS
MPHDMIDEYFEIYNNSIKEYGEHTCVFYACGSFYEVYRVDNKNETIGNANIIAEIIRCDFSNKNKSRRSEEGSTRAFPDFCGFGIPYLPKYLTPLLENNYTVVIVDQLETSSERKGKLVKRGIVAVHSPCLKGSNFETHLDTEFNLLNIFFEIIDPNPKTNRKGVLLYSICSLNNTTNTIEINENVIEFKSNEFRLCLDDVNKILSRYNTKEIRSYIISESCSDYTNILKKFFQEMYISYKLNAIGSDDNTFKEYSKHGIQTEYFKKVYKHINFGLIDPVEYLSLLDKPLSTINFMYLIDFMAAHDIKYTTNLAIPKIIRESLNLTLELNTIHQLNILPQHTINQHTTNHKISSIFDVVNYTITPIGRRHLKQILTKPFRNVSTIDFRYNLTEELMNNFNVKEIETHLSNIIDFDRLHRKMGLEELHPYEFERLHNTYVNIMNLFDTLKNTKYLQLTIPSDNVLQSFSEYISDYKVSFNLTEMKRIGLNTSREEFINFFNNNIVSDLDKIQQDIHLLETSIETLRRNFDDILNEKIKGSLPITNQSIRQGVQMVKLGFTDNDGYFFTCTKIRYQKLLRDCKNENFTMRSTSNMCKFYTDDLTKLSNRLITTRELLVKKVKLHYINKLQSYSNKYYNVFTELSKFVAIIDVSLSNMKCSKRNNYCRPNIDDNKESFFIAKQLRHPIIELINNDTEYIPNDIALTNESLGMLVYGLNSSGKSSLLRSIGVCLILAQSGLYTPCKSFNYAPFHTIISQVDLADNLFANKSSFTSEMCGLKRILNCAGKNTLVLSDELCRGTEVNSSCAIVVSTLLNLVNKNTKFFFTTHLHDLPQIPQISSQSRINICHLSVETKQENIIFERCLKPGSGSDLYGLEVCKSIIQDSTFIDLAFNIRNYIISNNTNIIDTKRSRYNKKKITDNCQVCGYKPKRGQLPLDTHHINEQKNCDESGFVNDKHFHKNKIYNLVSLCKSCHLKIDTGELVIYGYKSSISGAFLDYILN